MLSRYTESRVIVCGNGLDLHLTEALWPQMVLMDAPIVKYRFSGSL